MSSTLLGMPDPFSSRHLFVGSAISIAAVHDCLLSSDLLKVVPLLLDGEWLELAPSTPSTEPRTSTHTVRVSLRRTGLGVNAQKTSCNSSVLGGFISWRTLAR